VIERRTLPIADAPLLDRPARRTLVIRNGLTAALALLFASAVVVADRGRSGTAAPAAAAAGRTTEVVLDVSGSVGGSSYAATEAALRRLSRSPGRIGLIVFSDSAEEALPPGTPPAELASLLRFYTPVQPPQSSESLRPPTRYATNPWYPSFSGGTRMSAGLAAARRALRRDRVHGQVLLISDLGDAPSDRGALKRELVAYASGGLELRVLALPTAYGSDVKRFRQLLGAQAVRTSVPPPPPAAPRGGSRRESFPLALALLAVLIAGALAANELLAVSLRWREELT
jgi:VWA domain-containing protein